MDEVAVHNDIRAIAAFLKRIPMGDSLLAEGARLARVRKGNIVNIVSFENVAGALKINPVGIRPIRRI